MNAVSSNRTKLNRFIHGVKWNDMPPIVHSRIKHCVLDIVGAVIAGSRTKGSQIIRQHVSTFWQGGNATILISGQKANMLGAALANAFMANAIDIDDGYRQIKGHPGAVVFPAVLAAAEEENSSGIEFLTALLVGYEVAIRGGLAWHDYHAEYHSSGSWGSLGAVAGVARLFHLSEQETWNALGIAEYHAPISEMMRCIEVPTMTKDGAAWGSMVGISSAVLAKDGFTGISNILGMDRYCALVNSLGVEYEILNLYFKLYACCRWAQPAITGALRLKKEIGFEAQNIHTVKIRTFSAAARLAQTTPASTEEAQYNLTYPVAVALVDGKVGPYQVVDNFARDDEVSRLQKSMIIEVDDKFERVFPCECLSEIEIALTNGRKYNSGTVAAAGDSGNPLTDQAIQRKFGWLAGYAFEENQIRSLIEEILTLEKQNEVDSLLEMLRVKTPLNTP